MVPNGKWIGKQLGDRYPQEEAMERLKAKAEVYRVGGGQYQYTLKVTMLFECYILKVLQVNKSRRLSVSLRTTNRVAGFTLKVNWTKMKRSGVV